MAKMCNINVFIFSKLWAHNFIDVLEDTKDQT